MSQDRRDINVVKNFANGIYTKEEAEKALDFIKDKANVTAVDELMSAEWTDTEPGNSHDIEDYREEAMAFLKEIKEEDNNKTKYITLKRAIAYASSIAAALLIFFGGYEYFTAKHQEINYLQETTTFGERKTITLSDGTVVSLNACSKIKFPEKFDGDNRQVSIEGEAFFKVVKNPKQPFIVNTSKFDVTVLGTEFNVKAYEGDQLFAVGVESGKVQVDMPDAMTRLVKNEYLAINTSNNEFQKIVDVATIANWRNGTLVFNKTPIREVVKELERLYNYKFVFDENSSFDNLITGIHNNRSLKDVLSSIEYTSEIKNEISGKTVRFYK